MSDAEKRKLSQARVADLRAELEKRGLDKNGVKAVLVERLVSALAVEGLSSSEIDDYVVESASDVPKKQQAKRGITSSKTKDEDELMAELDNKSEVLDYGENDDLEVITKEDETLDTVETNQALDEEIKEAVKEADSKVVGLEEEFQVVDEESSDIEEIELKEGQQQESNIDNEDSIHLTLNEEEEKLLIDEDENGFSTESDAPAARSRSQARKPQHKHSASISGGGGSSSSSKKLSPSKEDDKADKNQETSSAMDASSNTSEKKKASSSPKGAERIRTSVDEKHSSSVGSTQQQSDEPQEGVNGDKLRSSGAPKESKEKSAEGNDNKRETSPSASNSSGRNLWVSGLSSTTRATDLKQTFSKYGKVLGAKVVTNARTPGARCYGFVTMAKREDAQRCIQHLDRTELHGRMISVEKAKGEATGPGRVKSASPRGSDPKQADGDKDGQKKESSKSGESSRDQRRDKSNNKPVRQRITAPSPGPTSDRSDSRSETTPRAVAVEPPPPKKRQRSRTPPPRVPPPRRVNHSPGGGLHTRRSASAVLTFASIKQARDRQRLREREREDREHARRREEEARRLERRQREEQIKIEREKEELRQERERIERARKDILRLEREKAKLERERLEWEREELRRQQQKLREMAERPPPPLSTHISAPSVARGWNPYTSSSQAESRYDDVRRGSGGASATKRHGDHHSSEYFDERAAKRPVPSSNDDRRGYDSTPTVPPPPRFSSSSASVVPKRPTDNRRDHEFSHRTSSSSFDRSSATGPGSGSSSYDRTPASTGRRDNYFPSSSTNSGGRVIEPTRREPDTAGRGKDDRYRDSFRPSVRTNDRALSGRDTTSFVPKGVPPPNISGMSGSSSSSRPRDRYADTVGRGIVASNTVAREPWLDRKSDASGSSWQRPADTTSSDRWPNNNLGLSSSRGSGLYTSSVPNLGGLGINSMGGGPPSNNIFNSADRYDAYKQPINSLRKY